MVHFPEFAHARLWIQRDVLRFCRSGFPHSDIPGSKLVCSSPRLIAAYHVLHRLLVPRHPPCALSSLTLEFTRTQQSDNLRNIESSTFDISPRLCFTTLLSTCEIQAGNTKIILKTLNTD